MCATILLVEDHEMNRDMLKRRLCRRGFNVLTAVDGQEGIETAELKRPDIILMDMSLPVMDGWEATKRLKSKEETKRIPVIALTAHAMAEDAAKAYDAGCDDFDTKPVDFERLLGKIQKAQEALRNACLE
ncbi:response regulator [Paenibacillus sp. J5C_2022]|uniref:response regulator n=1 Tax=Paenibacillus sp. J5C2022 TaxID=2977129 RepID=UPI0021D1054F|nr:response regulator [Paenibacillus sp. J5C2022]MCU6709616.1 response regulator [Paenibacillus sp. J5C2022]